MVELVFVLLGSASNELLLVLLFVRVRLDAGRVDEQDRRVHESVFDPFGEYAIKNTLEDVRPLKAKDVVLPKHRERGTFSSSLRPKNQRYATIVLTSLIIRRSHGRNTEYILEKRHLYKQDGVDACSTGVFAIQFLDGTIDEVDIDDRINFTSKMVLQDQLFQCDGDLSYPSLEVPFLLRFYFFTSGRKKREAFCSLEIAF